MDSETFSENNNCVSVAQVSLFDGKSNFILLSGFLKCEVYWGEGRCKGDKGIGKYEGWV